MQPKIKKTNIYAKSPMVNPAGDFLCEERSVLPAQGGVSPKKIKKINFSILRKVEIVI